jgi:hypothetical protein
MNTDEFLNPKSMLTPGIAGGIVMMITNSLLAHFALPLRWSALVLSFLLALLVFLSIAIPLWQRAIFYIFNALIIFSVAVGSNQVGSSSQQTKETKTIRASQEPAVAAIAKEVRNTQEQLQIMEERLVSGKLDEAERSRMQKQVEESKKRIAELEEMQVTVSVAPRTPPRFFKEWF